MRGRISQAPWQAVKKLLILLASLVVFILAAAATASWWVMGQMGPEVWVAQAEQHWNCRAQIDEASLNLLSKPATLVFKGVHIAQRDAEVAKPLKDRTPLTAASADVHIAEVRLAVRLEDLLEKRLHIEDLRLIEPVIRETQTPEGSTLQALFRSPVREGEVPAGSAPAAKTSATTEEQAGGAFSFALGAAHIERGSFFMNAKDTTVQVTALEYHLAGLDMQALQPGDKLDTRLSGELSVTGMTRIQGVKRQAEMARISLSGSGHIVPIHSVTRQWQPLAELQLILAQGSVLGGQQTIGDAAGKNLRKLEEFGIDLAPVLIGGPLQKDAKIHARWINGLFTLLDSAVFDFPEYEVTLAQKARVNTLTDEHDMDIRLSCGPQLQQRIQGGIANARLGKDFARGLITALSDQRGRLTFDIKSRGPLSDPRITPDTDRALKNLMSGRGLGDLLRGFLK